MRGTDVLRDFDFGWIEETAGVVLDVDDKGVDLGGVGQPDELFELVRAEGPRVDVESSDGFGRGRIVEQRLRQNVSQLHAAEPHAVGGGWQTLRKKAPTHSPGPEQEHACLPSQTHRGEQHRELAPDPARIKTSLTS